MSLSAEATFFVANHEIEEMPSVVHMFGAAGRHFWMRQLLESKGMKFVGMKPEGQVWYWDDPSIPGRWYEQRL